MARGRYETANGLLGVARECGLDETAFGQVPGGRALGILDEIFDAITTSGWRARRQSWLWENLRPPYLSLYAGAGLDDPLNRLVDLGAPATPVWLVTEDFASTKRGTPFWLFEGTLAGVTSVLQRHHLLEFYVVSRPLTWMVCENHHDVWCAMGREAMSWLEGVREAAANADNKDEARDQAPEGDSI